MARSNTRGGGWVLLAGSMLILVGGMNAFVGFIAIFDPEGAASMSGDPAIFTVANWGWIHLIVGALLMLVGVGVLALNPFARGAGILLVGVNALSHFASVDAHPFWSLTVIAIDVFIIYALAVYNDPIIDEK